MNKLYSILVNGRDIASSWYRKRTSAVSVAGRAAALVHMLVPTYADAALVACCLCRMAMLSSFWKEISERDPMNTYEQPARNGEVASALPSSTTLDSCIKLLDKELQARLSTPSVAERVGACCLQLLEDCNVK